MPDKFLDIDDVVKQWANRLFDQSASKKQAKLREKEIKKKENYIGITIDWSDVKFRDETRWPERLKDDSDASPDKDGDAVATRTALGESGAQTVASNVSVLFQTRFTNNTSDDQDYSLHTTKTTRSSVTTSIENGLTKGFDLAVNLKTPCEILEVNAGYHRETSLTNSEGETFEEEMTWGVDSTIKVKAHHVAEAELQVIENKKSGKFVIDTKIAGRVYVTFTNIRDNNSCIKSVGGNIRAVVEQYLKRCPLDFVSVEGDVVRVQTTGTCKFQYGIKQEVVVHQKLIPNSLRE